MIAVEDTLPLSTQYLAELGAYWVKAAQADSEISYALRGRLQLDRQGQLVLNVPNALVLGIYKALDVTGIELPVTPRGVLFAHAVVMTAPEVQQIGARKISERGKLLPYTLGRLHQQNGTPTTEWAQRFYLRLHSPQLQSLRRSYGLPSLPTDPQQRLDGFMVVVAIRRRGVLGYNSTRVRR